MSGADPAARRLPGLQLDPGANGVLGSIASQPVGETPEHPLAPGSLPIIRPWSGRDRSSISGLYPGRFDVSS
jgi:hypothetical protein